MHDSYYMLISRPRLIGLYITNIAAALVIGLCVAMPITGATFMAALGASCLAEAGCETPTFIDALVPIVAAASWLIPAGYIGVVQVQTLRKTMRAHPPLRLRRR